METKKRRISIDRVDTYVKDMACFGWELKSKDDLKPNHTIVLTFERNPEFIDDVKTVKKLEAQYERANRKIPLLAIILAAVGGALLAGFFLLKPFFVFYITLLYASLTCFCIAVFSLIIFILLISKRKVIIEYILKEAALRAGFGSEFPNKSNILEPEESTWALSKTFDKS